MQTLLQYREFFLGLIYVAYLWGVHPHLIERLQDVSPQTPDFGLGLLVFSLPFIDFIGHYLKRPIMVYMARQNQQRLGGKIPTLVRLLPWAHILLVGVLAFSFMVLFNLYGLLDGSMFEGFSFFIYFLFPGLIWMVLEGQILSYFNSPFGEDERQWKKYSHIVESSPKNSLEHFVGKLYLSISQRYPRNIDTIDYLKDALGDVFLLIFAMFGYTMIFDFIGVNAPLRLSSGPFLAMFDILKFTFLFILLYPPLRSAYFYMEQIVLRTTGQKVLSSVSFAAVLVSALLSMPRI